MDEGERKRPVSKEPARWAEAQRRIRRARGQTGDDQDVTSGPSHMRGLHGPNAALLRPQPHLVEFVSLLGLLLPTSLSSNAVFLSPPDLPVIVLRALEEDMWSGVRWRPLASPCLPSPLTPRGSLTPPPSHLQPQRCSLLRQQGSSSPLVREHSRVLWPRLAASPHDHPEKCVV